MRKTALILFTLVSLWGRPARAADRYAVSCERNLVVGMRDRVQLRADVYRPDAEGKFPVLLERTPYNKNDGVEFGIKAASRGYVVIFQDVRGRYASEGEWYPFKNEPNDGYDTVEWAAALPYSDGRVGMFGASYVGATQMLAAIAHPPHLAGICPVVTASNYHENWAYTGGAFAQWFNQDWTSGLAGNTYERLVSGETDPVGGIWTLPLTDFPILNLRQGGDLGSNRSVAPYFLDWLAHPSYDDYWKAVSIEEHFPDIKVPALHVAAWYDLFLGGSLANYRGIKARGGSGEARKAQQLVVEIGGHAGTGPKVGEVDFGPAAKEPADPYELRYYDYLFKGANNEFRTGKPVKIFVMGRNEWREEDDWPLARARQTRYFLHSGGKANSLDGNGRLSVASPGQEPADEYVYDPRNPAPTVGGPLCCESWRWPPGPRDQRSVEAREDVLVYSTPPMAEDTEVTGPVSLELYAKSSAVDTDFTAKLVDAWPDGFAQNLTEGILRARYRDSRQTPALMNPGQIYKLSIDLWATSNLFKKGHVLRLEVSSSNFPRFDRNLNTGELGHRRTSQEMAGAQFVRATNVILHDGEHPSALILPVVPAK